MKKHAFIFVLILMLALVSLPAAGQDPEDTPIVSSDETPQSPEEPLPDYSYDELVVGNPTHLEGNFYTDMWGDNTADLDVRILIHGYNLVTWDGEDGMFIYDPSVCNGLAEKDDGSGDRTYYISLYSDLYYSDGTPITAADYIFSFLMSIAPQVRELGGKPLRLDHISGVSEYLSGASKAVSGIRMTGEHQFSITIRQEYLPFFYELGLLYCTPSPMHVIAPGCTIRDDGNGVYIDGPFTAELLKQTILDPETGYLSHPSPVSGPYMLTAYDGTTAEFGINPYYKGDTVGYKPAIRRLVYTVADNETMIDRLSRGEFGLLNKVTRADAVTEGVQLTGKGYAMSNYPRIGLTFISFSAEKPTVSSQAVRQAIAYSFDKNGAVSDYVGNYGLRVDGFYGLGQWMYQLVNGTMAYPIEEPENPTAAEKLEYEKELERWNALTMEGLHIYDPDTEEAVRLLTEDGWTLNRSGGAFAPETDDVRCREIDGQIVPLDLTLAYPEGNRIAEILEERFVPLLREAGIALTLVPKSMEEVLDQFYRRTERKYDMLYLGTNFDIVFDPSAHFIPGENGLPTWNYTEMTDEELYQLAVDLRRTEPGNTLEYCERWLKFQERFSEVLPMIPLYSNIYFDFYPRILQDYYISSEVTWTRAIVPAFLGEPVTAEAEDEFEEDLFSEDNSEDLVEFED